MDYGGEPCIRPMTAAAPPNPGFTTPAWPGLERWERIGTPTLCFPALRHGGIPDDWSANRSREYGGNMAVARQLVSLRRVPSVVPFLAETAWKRPLRGP